MKFLVDAQLPPGLALWLGKQAGCSAIHLLDNGLIEKADVEIFFFARENDFIIVSKDSDFLDLVAYHGAPPKILFVTCGNIRNTELFAIFERNFKPAVELLNLISPVVEIG